MLQGSAALLPAMSVLGASEPSKIIPCISRDPAGTPCDLGVTARMTVAQLDPAHGARLFKCDRSCWKSGLRAARFTNAYQRRPSAPPRKMTADPVQCGGQPVPVHMLAFSRHVSIMRLLPLVDLRITRVFSCAARAFKARPSFMFASCCWWRSLAIDGYSGHLGGMHPPPLQASSCLIPAPCRGWPASGRAGSA